MYLDRFNFSIHDTPLLKGAAGASTVDSGREIRWANYCRSVLVRMRFYSLQALKGDLFLFVAESKSLPGRDPRTECEAIGRSLNVAWFESVESVGGDHTVRRVNRDGTYIALKLLTLAEILRAAGFFLLAPDGASARQVELALERSFMDHDLMQFEHIRETAAADDPYIFTSPTPIMRKCVFGRDASAGRDEDGIGPSLGSGTRHGSSALLRPHGQARHDAPHKSCLCCTARCEGPGQGRQGQEGQGQRQGRPRQEPRQGRPRSRWLRKARSWTRLNVREVGRE